MNALFVVILLDLQIGTMVRGPIQGRLMMTPILHVDCGTMEMELTHRV